VLFHWNGRRFGCVHHNVWHRTRMWVGFRSIFNRWHELSFHNGKCSISNIPSLPKLFSQWWRWSYCQRHRLVSTMWKWHVWKLLLPQHWRVFTRGVWKTASSRRSFRRRRTVMFRVRVWWESKSTSWWTCVVFQHIVSMHSKIKKNTVFISILFYTKDTLCVYETMVQCNQHETRDHTKSFVLLWAVLNTRNIRTRVVKPPIQMPLTRFLHPLCFRQIILQWCWWGPTRATHRILNEMVFEKWTPQKWESRTFSHGKITGVEGYTSFKWKHWGHDTNNESSVVIRVRFFCVCVFFRFLSLKLFTFCVKKVKTPKWRRRRQLVLRPSQNMTTTSFILF